MRDRAAWVLILALMILSVTATAPGDARKQPVSVFFQGDQIAFLDQQPMIAGDQTLVPVRGVFEPPLPVLAPADNPHVVMPCTIRVTIRPVPIGAPEPLQNGAYEVREVELAEYLVRVVAHEFGDFTEDNGMSHSYTTEPLKAGAMAALMVRQGNREVFAPQYGSGWYNERSQGTDWMNQRGSLYLSDKKGYNWEQILRYYYRNIEFREHTRPCAGPK